MLIITRKPEESIVILFGEKEVRVTIDSVRRNRVRVVVDGPRDVFVAREELYEQIYKDLEEA